MKYYSCKFLAQHTCLYIHNRGVTFDLNRELNKFKNKEYNFVPQIVAWQFKSKKFDKALYIHYCKDIEKYFCVEKGVHFNLLNNEDQKFHFFEEHPLVLENVICDGKYSGKYGIVKGHEYLFDYLEEILDIIEPEDNPYYYKK